MSKIIGIDLGTTYSAIAQLDDLGNPEVLSSTDENRKITASTIYVSGEKVIVGDKALDALAATPKNVISETKRQMENDVVYSVEKGAWVEKDEAEENCYTPAQVSSFILSKLKGYTSDVQKAVITVPALFAEKARVATLDAAKMAGIEVIELINEPTAAACYYASLPNVEKITGKILVFDLGGGTFDVSILEVGEGVFEVLATSGDTQLGGDDFDEKIVQWLIKEFKDQEGIDLSKDIQALQRLTEAAEKSKIELSTLTKSSINLPFISVTPEGPKHLERELTREKFETLCSDLIARCKIPIELSLKDAELAPSKIAENVLVGGSTRIPAVQELLKKLLGKTPNQSVNPDEVVAIGAAVQAGVLGGEVTDILLLDVTPLSLGVETLGGITTKITPRNTTVPTKKFETFSTAADNQTTVEIHVLQGERDLAKDNKSLGTFKLGDIQPAARGVPQIKVTFDIDTSGILSVTAKDETTNKQQSITISGASTLPQDEVERMVKDAEANAAADKLKSQQIETKNQAEAICYQVKKDLEESKFSLSPEEQKNLNTHVSELEEAVRQDNYTAMAEKIKVIEQVIRDIEQNSTQKAENVTEKGDDVIDAEFSSEE